MDRRGAMKEKKITVVWVGVLLLAALFLGSIMQGSPWSCLMFSALLQWELWSGLWWREVLLLSVLPFCLYLSARLCFWSLQFWFPVAASEIWKNRALLRGWGWNKKTKVLYGTAAVQEILLKEKSASHIPVPQWSKLNSDHWGLQEKCDQRSFYFFGKNCSI